MRYFVFVFFQLFCSTVIAQISISGVVTDKRTGEALPYVTVHLKFQNKYSRTDENGIFKIYTSQQVSSDTLTFSSVGYFLTKVSVNQESKNLKVEMGQDVRQLREVKISGREMVLGAYTKNGYQPYKGTSMITRRFMKNDSYSYLKRVVIWRKPDRDSGKTKTKFRITIYNSEDWSGPPNGVVYEQILTDDTENEELVVDLVKDRILLPTNFFFVGVERISDPSGKNHEPWVNSIKDKQHSWVKLFGADTWQKTYIKPAIAAVVM